MAWILQQRICSILTEAIVPILYNSPVKVFAGKGQQENRLEQYQRRGASEFADTTSAQKSTDVEITHERRNSILELCSLLLFLKRQSRNYSRYPTGTQFSAPLRGISALDINAALQFQTHFPFSCFFYRFYGIRH